MRPQPGHLCFSAILPSCTRLGWVLARDLASDHLRLPHPAWLPMLSLVSFAHTPSPAWVQWSLSVGAGWHLLGPVLTTLINRKAEYLFKE